MKRLTLAILSLAFCSSAFALPIHFKTSYDITANTDDGLLIETEDYADNPFEFDLNYVGDTYSLNLFKIWTEESDVGGDDTVPQSINVEFTFLEPAGGGSATGETSGDSYWTTWFIIPIQVQYGVVSWNPAGYDLNFAGGGLLRVFLEGEEFGESIFGLSDDPAKIKAKFKLVQAPTATAVPEPSSLALIGMGLLAAGLVRRPQVAADRS